ncbi:MAG: hypothetical protein R3330_04660 [Saprospiraceae bacterium]|nr:hypothetical protein [Saprospiraceae bacterium]
MTLRHAFLFFGFLIILAIPTVDQLTGFSERLAVSSEKRQLASLPAFDFPHFERFVDEFDSYYQDNFGMRNVLFAGYSNMKYHGLGVSPLPHKVLVGKDNWLFGGNDLNGVVRETMGLDTFSTAQLERVAQRIQDTRTRLRQQGTSYYLMVVPNKHSVYPEFLPDYVTNDAGVTKLDQVKRYLKERIDLDIIDLRDIFGEAKEQFQIYYQTDSHWNYKGAFIGYLYLMQRLRLDYPQLQMMALSDLEKVPLQRWGDLTQMINMDFTETDTVLAIKETCAEMPKKLQVPQSFPLDPNLWEVRYQCNPGGRPLKLLVYRDSFSAILLHYLKKSFGESVYVWSVVENQQITSTERPDIVIQAMGERLLEFLAR